MPPSMPARALSVPDTGHSDGFQPSIGISSHTVGLIRPILRNIPCLTCADIDRPDIKSAEFQSFVHATERNPQPGRMP